jgi:hypothetical protein
MATPSWASHWHHEQAGTMMSFHFASLLFCLQMCFTCLEGSQQGLEFFFFQAQIKGAGQNLRWEKISAISLNVCNSSQT